ncbi:MAG: mucoidy inhibitor MuiA family protein [Bacteroidota bacterium]
MKNFRLRLLLLAVIVSTTLHAADINVKPQTKEVLVYLQNAQVSAVAEVSLTPGMHNIILEDLSQYLDENSVQIKGDADFTILSVVTKKNYLGEERKEPKLKALEDSIDVINTKLTAVKNQLDALNEELAMIKSNQSITGDNVGVSTLELEKMANFYRVRMLEIHNKQSENERKQGKLREKMQTLQNQYVQLKNQQTKVFSEITLAIKCNSSTKSKIQLTYMVANAGWMPFYDIKSESLNEPITILGKANVYQNTGEDWKNVKLSLSTGNPTYSNAKPNLYPYTLMLSNPDQLYKKGYSRSMELPTSNSAGIVMEAPAAADVRIRGGRNEKEETYIDGIRTKNTSEYTNNTENQTNNIFDISIPYSIPSDGKEYVVAIQEYKAPAIYSYSAIPKLDKDAFLLANLINWDQTGLLPGDANLFNEGTFVGKSYFETRVTNDTIPVSLGREKNIILDRKKVKSFTEKNFTGGTKKTTLEFEIMVRNKKKSEVEITIEDQIPLSNTEEVSIELINGSNASYVKETGKLKWVIKLKPSESNTLKFGYVIKYPKRYNISNL